MREELFEDFTSLHDEAVRTRSRASLSRALDAADHLLSLPYITFGQEAQLRVRRSELLFARFRLEEECFYLDQAEDDLEYLIAVPGLSLGDAISAIRLFASVTYARAVRFGDLSRAVKAEEALKTALVRTSDPEDHTWIRDFLARASELRRRTSIAQGAAILPFSTNGNTNLNDPAFADSNAAYEETLGDNTSHYDLADLTDRIETLATFSHWETADKLADVLLNLGVCYRLRYEQDGDLGSLTASVCVLRWACSWVETPDHLSELSVSLRMRGLHLSSPTLLNEAVEVSAMAIRACEVGTSEWHRCAWDRAVALKRLFSPGGGQLTHLDEAIALEEQMLHHAVQDGEYSRLSQASNLANSYLMRGTTLKDQQDVRRCVEILEGIGARRHSDAGRVTPLAATYVQAVFSSWEIGKSLGDLDRCINLTRILTNSGYVNAPNYWGIARIRLSSLIDRFIATEEARYLEEASSAFEVFWLQCTTAEEERGLLRLGFTARFLQYLTTRDQSADLTHRQLEKLMELLDKFQRDYPAMTPSQDSWIRREYRLSSTRRDEHTAAMPRIRSLLDEIDLSQTIRTDHWARYELLCELLGSLTGDDMELGFTREDLVARLLREAVSPWQRAIALGQHLQLVVDFERVDLGALELLEEAWSLQTNELLDRSARARLLQLSALVWESIPSEHPQRPAWLERSRSAWGRIILETRSMPLRYAEALAGISMCGIELVYDSHDQEELEYHVVNLRSAIAAYEEHIDALDSRALRRLEEFKSALGAGCQFMYQLTNAIDWLDECIDVTNEVRDSDQLMLAVAKVMRYEATGHSEDLTEAIDSMRDLLESGAKDKPLQGQLRSELTTALRLRGEVWDDVEAYEEVVSIAEPYFDDPASAPPGLLDNAASSALQLFLATEDERWSDLTLRLTRSALEGTPQGFMRVPLLLNTASRLLAFFQLESEDGGPDSLLDEADALASEAEQILSRYDGVAGLITTLRIRGNIAAIRAERQGSAAHWEEAKQILRLAQAAAGDDALERIQVADQLAGYLVKSGDQNEAIALYGEALRRIREIAPAWLDPADHESRTSSVAGIVSRAVKLAVEAHDYSSAVAFFNYGQETYEPDRWGIGSESIERLSLTDPGLASEMIRADDEMAQYMSQVSGQNDQDRSLAWAYWERRDEVIARVRRMPGFGSFGLADPFELHPGSQRTLLLIWCDSSVEALLVEGTNVRHKRIDVEPPADFPTVVNEVTGAVFAASYAREDVVAAEKRLSSALHWLWDHVVERLLSAFDMLEGVGSECELPRLRWIAAGPLAAVPWHAVGPAGSPRSGEVGVIDCVVSSYGVSLNDPGGDPGHRVSGDEVALAVAMPTTPGFGMEGDLPGVEREVRILRKTFDSQLRVLGLPGTQAATSINVLSAIQAASFVHFSCHIQPNIVRPHLSYLVLRDHMASPLTAEHLSRTRVTDAKMAFVSACGSGVRNAMSTSDTLNVNRALQRAGFMHIIGTLWPVLDNASAEVCEGFYAAFHRGDTVEFARILHAAVRVLRHSWPHAPSVWAPFVHLGP